MADPKLLEQAKQGDAIALQTLLNNSLRPHGIWARMERQEQALQICLESTQAPDAEAMAKRIRAGLQKLHPRGIASVTLSGWGLGDTEPTWEYHIQLDHGTVPGATQGPRMPLAEPPPAANIPSAPSTLPGPNSTSPRHIPQLRATYPTRTQNPARSLQPQRILHSSHKRRAKQPFVLKWSDFDPMMLAIIGFVAIYGFLGARNPDFDGPFIWLHYPNLAIHETGHLLFMPFGHFLMVLGGSLTQILFPAVFTGYFVYSRQYFSSVLTLFWTGQNFMDVAVYMADAPYRALPLTTPNIDAHDWWQLFNLMNCMNQAELVAALTHGIGVLIYVASIVAGVYVAYRHKQTMDAERQRLEERLHGSP